MRMTHLARSWGFVIALSLWFGLAAMPVQAQQTGKTGVAVTLTNISLKTVLTALASENGLKLIVQTDEDPVLELVSIPELTPVEEIISNIAKSVGLDTWKEGDTWFVGKRRLVEVKPVIDPLPTTPVKTTPPQVTLPAYRTSDLPAPVEVEKPSVMRKIELQFSSAREMMYMLGLPGNDIQDKSHRREMQQRIQKLTDPSDRKVDVDRDSSGTSPWLSGVLGRRSSASDANQFPGQPFPPITLPPTGQPPTGQPPVTQPPGGTQPGTGATAGLKDFLPKGIQTIVGLIGLNALLVKAETEDDIDQLVQLIKLLDQPIKQVVIEVMFVDMSVKDAMSLGASWEYAGMPISATSLNGGNDGNFVMRYIKGNIRATLSSLISTSKSKVVNAPRLIVQNGRSGDQISLNNSIPFVVLSEEQDVFGRTITEPEIYSEEFEQGLVVNEVTIHPDDSVTLEIEPLMSVPTVTGVPVPGGGSGEIFGRNDLLVTTRLRVKSGETMMMGGFVSRNELESGTRTPLFSNLPVIGPLLFGSRGHSTDNSETLIFVTPTIMKDDTTTFGGMGSLPPLF